MSSTSTTPSTPASSAARLKAAVRSRYAEVARSGSGCGCGSPGGEAAGCSLPDPSIAAGRAASESVSASGGCCSGGSAASARVAGALDLGCGNPLPFAGIREGDTVLDLGSGSGTEVLRAARMVGPRGRAIGVDLTPEMLELARRNAVAAGVANVEFLEGDVERLPLPDSSVDVIVSNCVLNLTPDKAAAFGEAFRVLRPGGRFVVADVVVAGVREPEPAWRSDPEGWSACVRGAMTEEGYARGLRQAGFQHVALERIAGYDVCTPGEMEVELVSDLIRARKPDVTFGALEERDLPEAFALLHEARLSETGLEAEALASGAARVFGLRAQARGDAGASPGELVATGAWERGADAVLVRSLAVRERLRGNGLGALLLQRLLGSARSEGAAEAFLFTESAEGFFAAQGWSHVARSVVAERFPDSAQVQGLCPASAVPMRRSLAEEPRRE